LFWGQYWTESIGIRDFGIRDLKMKTGECLKRLCSLFGVCLTLWLAAVAQPASEVPPLLSVEKVVENLVRMNAERAHALRSYEGKRTYRLQYHGFPGSRSAEMVVDVKYEAPGKKEFIIESATG